MADLTQEKIRLLDRLYNLRGDDSVITTNIQTKIEDIQNKTEETERIKREQEGIKTDLESELEKFTSQATSFLEAFSNYDNDSFGALNAVDIKIDLGDIVSKLKDEKPKHENDLNSRIEDTKNVIEDKRVQIEELKTEQKNEEEKLEHAENVKSKLNNLLDDILVNENDSYNRGYIKKLINELEVFNEDETNELEFLILFPEKGLTEYVNEYMGREDKFIPIFDEEKEETIEEKEEPVEEVEEPVTEEIEEETVEEEEEEETPIFTPVIEEKEEDIITLFNDDTKEEELEDFEIKAEDINIEEEEEEPVIEEKEEETKEEVTEEVEETLAEEEPKVVEEVEETDELTEFFKDNNVELNVDEETKNILEEANKDTLKLNIEQLKGIDFENDELFTKVDNYMYLTDKELSQKINFLRSKGITDKNIKKEFINGNLIYDLETLTNKFETLKDNNIDINESNLSVLELDIANYYENVEKLNKAGIELDEKESRNYKEVLSIINYVDEDTQVLKEYLIKIIRKNGKYAIDALWNTPVELSTSIDSLLENDLEKLIESNPEVLGKNIETVLRVIKYCEENQVPIVDEDNPNVFYKYIYDYDEFRKLFKTAELPKLNSIKDNNDAIVDNIKNDMTKKIIESLDEVYNKDKYDDINLDPTTNDKYDKIINSVVNTLEADQVSGNIYKINDVLVSKNKLERNTKIIVDLLAKDGESLDGLEKNILLIAALYNLRLEKNTIKTIIEKVIGIVG